MASSNTYEDSAMLTTPVSSFFGISSGKLFGINLMNFFEAVGMTALVLLIISVTPLTSMLKIIAGLIYGIPIFVINAVGIQHEDIIRYLLSCATRKRNGAKRQLSPPIEVEVESEDDKNQKVSEVPVNKNIKESLLWRIAEKMEQ